MQISIKEITMSTPLECFIVDDLATSPIDKIVKAWNKYATENQKSCIYFNIPDDLVLLFNQSDDMAKNVSAFTKAVALGSYDENHEFVSIDNLGLIRSYESVYAQHSPYNKYDLINWLKNSENSRIFFDADYLTLFKNELKDGGLEVINIWNAYLKDTKKDGLPVYRLTESQIQPLFKKDFLGFAKTISNPESTFNLEQHHYFIMPKAGVIVTFKNLQDDICPIDYDALAAHCINENDFYG